MSKNAMSQYDTRILISKRNINVADCVNCVCNAINIKKKVYV